MLVAAGFAPAEAIRAATINCAEMVGSSATLGQIKAGGLADLFAVEGDPLQHIEDLLRIKLIVRGGEVFDRQELLAQAKRAAR
jgi:imidazolonepropionase-like amidohydrolase